MALGKTNPTQTKAWNELASHFTTAKKDQILELFKAESNRAEDFFIQWNDFAFDYSKNCISDKTRALLLELANEVNLKDAIDKYFSGDLINETENRAVLHTALRANPSADIRVNGENVMAEVASVKAKIKAFSNAVISGSKKGYTGKAFTDVVNIGIGGSDLGPAMVVEALAYYQNHLKMHFVSNVDGDHVSEVIKGLNPETTLFVGIYFPKVSFSPRIVI